jgi:hypothetical protein
MKFFVISFQYGNVTSMAGAATRLLCIERAAVKILDSLVSALLY